MTDAEEQQALFDAPAAPKLTPLQQFALTTIQDAGWNGLTAPEVGVRAHAWRGKHAPDRPCDWCTQEGRRLLERLKKDGLVKYKRPRGGPGFWRAANAEQPLPSGMTDAIPF